MYSDLRGSSNRLLLLTPKRYYSFTTDLSSFEGDYRSRCNYLHVCIQELSRFSSRISSLATREGRLVNQVDKRAIARELGNIESEARSIENDINSHAGSVRGYYGGACSTIQRKYNSINSNIESAISQVSVEQCNNRRVGQR